MNFRPKRTALALAAALAFSGVAFGSGSTPTWEDALEASPNRLTAAEQSALDRRATSGESAREAPAGTYAPNANEAAGTRAPAAPTMPAVPADKAKSRDDAGARNDIAPRKREVPADPKRG